MSEFDRVEENWSRAYQSATIRIWSVYIFSDGSRTTSEALTGTIYCVLNKEIVHKYFTHRNNILSNMHCTIHIVAEGMADSMPVHRSSILYVNIWTYAIADDDYYDGTWWLPIDPETV